MAKGHLGAELVKQPQMPCLASKQAKSSSRAMQEQRPVRAERATRAAPPHLLGGKEEEAEEAEEEEAGEPTAQGLRCLPGPAAKQAAPKASG